MNPDEFKKYATMHRGISSITLENYMSVTETTSPLPSLKKGR